MNGKYEVYHRIIDRVVSGDEGSKDDTASSDNPPVDIEIRDAFIRGFRDEFEDGGTPEHP